MMSSSIALDYNNFPARAAAARALDYRLAADPRSRSTCRT